MNSKTFTQKKWEMLHWNVDPNLLLEDWCWNLQNWISWSSVTDNVILSNFMRVMNYNMFSTDGALYTDSRKDEKFVVEANGRLKEYLPENLQALLTDWFGAVLGIDAIQPRGVIVARPKPECELDIWDWAFWLEINSLPTWKDFRMHTFWPVAITSIG